MKRRALLLSLSLAAVGTVAALTWLIATQSGLQNGMKLLAQLSGGQLQAEQVSGRLYDRLNIGKLRWQGESTSISVEGVALHWSPLALLHGELSIHALGLGDVSIETRSNNEPLLLPDSLALPVAVRIAALEIKQLHLNGTLLAESTGAAFDSRAGMYTLTALEMRRGPLQLKAYGTLAAQSPYALEAQAVLDGEVAEKPFALKLDAKGELARIEATLQQTDGPFALSGTATVLPFSPQLLDTLTLQAKAFDLAALLPGSPHTQIDATCRMLDAETEKQVVLETASCTLSNRLAGPIDHDRLPVKQITARLVRNPGELEFSGLRIDLGSSSLRGKASLNERGLIAHLNAQALDLAAIHSKMQRTQLAGPVVLQSDTQQTKARLDLKGEKLGILTELALQADTLTLDRFELSAMAARLAAKGRLRRPTGDFNIDGTLAHFDPARFLRMPAGDINGDLKAHGRLSKSPQLSLNFALRDSRLADAPAVGSGQFDLAWPNIRRANATLTLGANQLKLAGALGNANDVLKLDIEAPALAPYGMDGDLQAHIEASGKLTAPLLNGRIRSKSVRLPGIGRFQQLSLDANMGTAADAPLELRLLLDRLDLPSRTNAFRKLDLDLRGTRRQHRLQLAAYLSENRPLNIAAHGSFLDKPSTEWQGALSHLSLDNPEANRSLKLEGDAPLAFGPMHWSAGPARIKTRNATFNLNANAAQGKLQARLLADNSNIGKVSLEVSAISPDVWNVSAQTPWQGRLQAAISDLAWVNPLLGAVWQAGGRLDADVQLGGTPQYPLLNGTVEAKDLALRQLDLGMNLRNGTLRANIKDSILRLNEFSIESALTTPPQALQRLLDDKGKSLTSTPGKITAQGHMKLGTLGLSSDASEQLRLDINVDRLGLSQTQKQWLLLSGQGQLSWQQARLGVNAKLEVDAAHWQLAELSRPQLSSDVVIRGSADASSKSAIPWTGTVEASLGRYFSFEGAGASGRLAGRVQVTASAQDLARASGSVNLVNGRYNAYGQQLDIERGILNFQGLLENPALNILALRRGLPVEAGVEITGYAQSPKVRLVSEPNVPDTEKLSWLVLGRPPEQEGADAGVLLGAVGAIFGNDVNNVGQNVKRSFGIDEISVRSGNLGQQQNMGSRIVSMSDSTQSTGQVLAVGRQLSNRLRLSYEQAIGNTGSLVKITLKLSDKFSVVGTSGSDAALDAYYGFAFGGSPAPPKSK